MTNPFAKDAYAKKCKALIGLLEDQSQSVWLPFAGGYINWDFAEYVLYWMISHPKCCKEVAAVIFGRSCPSNLYWQDYKEGFWDDRSLIITHAIIERWNNDQYSSENLYFDDKGFCIEINALIRSREEYGETYPDLDIPEDLLSFTPGKKNIALPSNLDPFKNPKVWDILASLGHFCGDRPA